ncbi:hypothetical protein AAG747_13455 [Rapidithrix thailandica]|uniref:Uncharacterized protein n=1 Tax=Rapidithrix thailandica TaxID=413964 RepID=A0AAW9S922_9BACT
MNKGRELKKRKGRYEEIKTIRIPEYPDGLTIVWEIYIIGSP